MATPILSKGWTLKLGSVAIGGLTSVSIAGRSLGFVETTNLNSTVRTYMPTILDNGNCTGEVQFDPDDTTGQAAMEALLVASPPAAATFTVASSDTTPTTYTFSGILNKFDIGASSVDDLATASFDIKISGAITRA